MKNQLYCVDHPNECVTIGYDAMLDAPTRWFVKCTVPKCKHKREGLTVAEVTKIWNAKLIGTLV